MSTNDQRRAVRVSVNEEYARIEDFLAEYVTNISETGLFLRSREILPVGTHVRLRFSIMLDDFETIEGEGEVVRIVDDEEGRGMGVRFTHLTDATRELLLELGRREAAAAQEAEQK